MGGRLEGWRVSSICVFLVRVFRSQDGGVGTEMVRVFVCVCFGYSQFWVGHLATPWWLFSPLSLL